VRNKLLANLQPGKNFVKPTRDILKEEKVLNSTLQKHSVIIKMKNRFLKQSSQLMMKIKAPVQKFGNLSFILDHFPPISLIWIGFVNVSTSHKASST